VLRDGDTAVAYYIGFERTPGVGNTVYLALLHSVIGDAIEMRCRRVSFGRNRARAEGRPRRAAGAPLAVGRVTAIPPSTC